MTVDPTSVSHAVRAQQEPYVSLLRVQIMGEIAKCDDLPTLRMIYAVFHADTETKALRRLFWS